MSNLGISGFDKYHKRNEFAAPTREDLENYFVEVFYHKPSKEQLEMFHKYLIGIEQDAQKMIDFCSKKDENQQEREKC